MLLSGFVKGAIAFGFPTVATPLLALVMDVKTAVVILILPNLVMDGVQAGRRGGLFAVARRLAPLLVAGMIGIVLGTRLLVSLPPRTATLILGTLVVLFVALNTTRFTPRVPAAWEPWLGPPVGLVAGLVGGITNVPGAILVIYFYALGMTKHDFVRSVSFTFLVLKLTQLAAVSHYGLLTWRLLAVSAPLTAVAFAGFSLGLRVQDRLEQRAFNRVVLIFLAALGASLIYRAAF